MSTDNKEQGSRETIQTRSGVASDDKSKGGDFAQMQASAGNDASASEAASVATSHGVAERGGSAIDDRSKDFEVLDPKA
jgi:hypothetical protein